MNSYIHLHKTEKQTKIELLYFPISSLMFLKAVSPYNLIYHRIWVRPNDHRPVSLTGVCKTKQKMYVTNQNI